ncbi:MAG: hypothetical protein P4L65_10710 [Legionella sp.]|nr:hypothetical protein [Legionella sp.]
MAHEVILQLGSELGYINNEDLAGVCHGVTLAWISACMINEEKKLNEMNGPQTKRMNCSKFPLFLNK